jgi:hypothetical protein
MADRKLLISELQAVRDEMNAVVVRIDPSKEISPGWTVKDVLAHITGWDEVVNTSLRSFLGCGELDITTIESIDDYNAKAVAVREGMSLDEVMADWSLTRRELIALLREIPQDRWDEPHPYAWGETGTVSDEIRIFIHHEREHANEIRALID